MPRMAKVLYRISALVFLLFALGHTVGFLTFRPATADALAVLDGMERVHFAFGGSPATWSEHYRGFGLIVSTYFLLAACLAWRLASATVAEAGLARTVAWILTVFQLPNIVLCLHYFGLLQAGFATACAVSLGWAAIQTRTE